MKWDFPSSQVDEEFEVLEEKVVGFDDCVEPIDFFLKFWNELYAVFGVLLASGESKSKKRLLVKQYFEKEYCNFLVYWSETIRVYFFKITLLSCWCLSIK